MRNQIRFGLFLGFFALSAVAATARARPNILFIMTDDQSYRSVGCYEGSRPWVNTPNIDRLAESGVKFATAYVGTWCMPARVSLLTGRLPHAVETVRMEGPYPGVAYDPQQAPFWPSVLRDHGYTTAHIGKWHVGADTGAGRDWDYQAAWLRPKRAENPDGTSYFYDQKISFNGAPAQPVRGYSTDNYTEWADAFVRGANRDADQPWYLWLCYTAPHHPFVPAERHRFDYLREEVPVPSDIFPPRPGKPAYMQKVREFEYDDNGMLRAVYPAGFPLREGVHDYNRSIRAIDEGVGRLLDTLAETGQLENTLVVFTSDQGYAWGEHGFIKKVAPYDANIRAPLIVSQPGTVLAGHTVDRPVTGLDLIPTFFEQAGIALPWRMHGHDLSPLLQNETATWPHPVMLSYTGWTYGRATMPLPEAGMDGHSHVAQVPWYVMLRKGNFKYIRTLVEGEGEELYDLNADPDELTNLAGEPDQRQRVLRLRGDAVAQLRRTEAPFVDALPSVRSLGP
ncbi:sulfatase family protein [Synoicihabitans lomoniglobus]|uniref:Sulfatase-like hydrolase/transferase n=1 Tax=Synoicihabitans lomoniglobus TaxID=2909285 RepID=A0AAE9ZVZ1_9BACT|nr:sulfatase-like hydrolase/transferase [Opitutaceae bacterium LMO-M01]WED64094.1 sulfatase-like hydrolase/transferase [Opitutaceae bacterium LMO-M01]